MTGVWYDKIEEGSVVKIKANEVSDLQLFRVYKSSKPMKGIVTYSCRHISYDLVGLPMIAYQSRNVLAGTAMSEAFAACPLDHPFTAWSDKTVLSDMNIDRPRSLRSFCGGESGSVLDVYGGEFEFDNFTVKLHKNRGADNGVVINYGKNLTDAKQEANIENCYTHLCPYAVKPVQEIADDGTVTASNDEVVTLSEGLIELINPASVGHKRVKIVDLSDKFGMDEPITEDAVRAYANKYIDSHDLHSPAVNITLSFMQIWDSAEFRKTAILERVALCDTVTVYFDHLGIDTKAKVVKTTYDALSERFTKIEIGSLRSNLADTVAAIEAETEANQVEVRRRENAIKVDFQTIINNATQSITGNSGGNVVLRPAENPQEVLIMDTDDINTAVQVWRWNSAGFGHSSNGVNGPYGLAITADGKIVADYVCSGTLKSITVEACEFRGGQIDIGSGTFSVNEEGLAVVKGKITAIDGVIGGCTIVDGLLQVPAARITSKLTANQIDVTDVITAGKAEIETIDPNKIDAEYIAAKGLTIKSTAGATLFSAVGSTVSIAGWSVDGNSIYKYPTGVTSYGNAVFMCTGTTGSYEIGGSESLSGWCFGAGGRFGVTSDGAVYANDIHIIPTGSQWSQVGSFYVNGEYLQSFEPPTVPEGTVSVLMNSTSLIAAYREPGATQTTTTFSTWANVALAGSEAENSASDPAVKHNIEPLDNRYDDAFYRLKPCRFKYNFGTSGRYHPGFIATQMEQAILDAGLTTQEFSPLVHLEVPMENGSEWMIRLEKLVPLCVDQIQKINARLAALEAGKDENEP